MIVSPASMAMVNLFFDNLLRIMPRWILRTRIFFEVIELTASRSPVSMRRESRVEPMCGLVPLVLFAFGIEVSQSSEVDVGAFEFIEGEAEWVFVRDDDFSVIC